MLERTFKLKGRTVVRTRREIAQVVKALEKEDTTNPEWRCNVIFLRHTIDPKRTLKTISLRADIERVVCCPGTWLWSARISGLSRSAMMKLGKTPLYQEMTVRNANTTRAVLALMETAENAVKRFTAEDDTAERPTASSIESAASRSRRRG
jgi:uncharacterized protein (DUF1697 family)